VNFSPRSPLGMGILEMAEVLVGLRSRSMRRGTLGAEGGLGTDGLGEVVIVDASGVGAFLVDWWMQR
jgi:hypothetical protein